MITLTQAKTLTPGTILYSNEYTNADGTPQRWKVNGQPKLWKTMPHQVKVPLKHGLYDYAYLTPDNFYHFTLTEDDAKMANFIDGLPTGIKAHLEGAKPC